MGLSIPFFVISFLIGKYVELAKDGEYDIIIPIDFVTYNPRKRHDSLKHKRSTDQGRANRTLQKKMMYPDQWNLLMKLMRKEYQFHPIRFEEGEVINTKFIHHSKRASIALTPKNRNDPYQRLMGVLESLRPRFSYIRKYIVSPKKSRSSMNNLEAADRSKKRLDSANQKLLRIYRQIKSIK